MTRLKYYISGPITGIENYNKEAFDKAAEAVRKHSCIKHQFVAVNPHDLDLVDHWPTDLQHDELWVWCMKRDIKYLCDCDAVVLLPGWELSRGARMEVYVASKFGLPFFRIHADGGLVEQFISIDDPEITPLIHSSNWE